MVQCCFVVAVGCYVEAAKRAPRLSTTRSSQDEASDRFRAEAVPLVHSRSVPSDRSNSTTKNAHFVIQKGHIVQSDVIHLVARTRCARRATARGPRLTTTRSSRDSAYNLFGKQCSSCKTTLSSLRLYMVK